MKTSVKYSPHSSGWIAMGVTALLCTLPGNLRSDDKKPVARPAAPSRPATAPAARPAAAPSGGTASHVPGAGRAAGGATAGGGGAHPGGVTAGPGAATHTGGVTAGAGGNRPGGMTAGGGGNHPGGVTAGAGGASHTGGVTAGQGGGAMGRPTAGGAGGTRPNGGFGGGANHTAGGGAGAGGNRPTGGTQFGRNAPNRQPGSMRAPVAHAGHNVYNAPGGRRGYERSLPGGRRVYASGRGNGYIHNEYRYGGQRVYQRVYYVNGRAYPRYYNPYLYHGIEISVYAPPRYYAAGFYGWAYNPWAVPVVYGWGFASAPWYGYYGGYFTPYPTYASPSLWLTDYLIANQLEAGYAAQRELAQQQQFAQQQAYAPLTPDVKAQIAEEVKRQIALENNERQTAQGGLPDPASSGVARMFADNNSHVFVVAAPLNVDSPNGQCPVTEGDVLQLSQGQAPSADGLANVVVLASKGQDCQRGATVTVGVADLQDMQNAMRQTIDQGMEKLQQTQGQGGLPSIPASANTPPVETAYAKIGPPPPPDGAQQISQEWNDGNKAEQTMVDQSMPQQGNGQENIPTSIPQPTTPQAEPVQLGPGMTIAEVEAAQGKPTTILSLGPTKKIYVYKNFKVTFTNGKVTDIQ